MEKTGVRLIPGKTKSALEHKDAVREIDTAVINQALSDGLVQRNREFLSITTSGKSKLRRQLCDVDPHATQHRVLTNDVVKHQSTPHQVTVNCAESPLARLYARKQKDGKRYFSLPEYESGNRLRRDFEKSRMQPNISANWHGGMSGSNNSRRGGGGLELSDMAIDARARLQKAMDALGPELAGVTLDICCYLKGFELVEGERGWPSRSAKLMLKTALARLSRHYGYDARAGSQNKKGKANINHWGVSDYRPSL